MKLLLPCWLVFLAAFSGLPATARAADRVLPRVSLQPQSATEPVTSLPTSTVETNLPSQSRIQPPDASSRPNLRFDCFSATDGLSFSLTTSILQDERGFMWFGTRYGLDKYDGSTFEVYFPGPSGDVMGGNFIIDLHQDRAGDLWMATSIDVVRRDAKTGAFVHYDRNSLTPGRINAIGEDAAGTIWIGTNGGLNRYDPAMGTFARVLQDEAVLSITPDRQGGLWLGTASGVWYTTPDSFVQQRPVQYRHDPADPASLSNDIVIAVHEDSQGALWVGTQYGGLNRLDRASGGFTHYLHDPDDPYSLSDDRVYAILEDGSGRLWIGTQNGLNLLDRSTGRFYRYHFDPADPHSLRHNVVSDLYQDRAGVLWIATLAGVCKLNETASAFTFYQQGPSQRVGQTANLSYVLSDNLIGSIYQDRDGILWVGTSQGGLNRLDRVSPASPATAGPPSGGRVTVYRYNPDDPNSISWGEVAAIYEDRAGTLWIGTSGGLNRFDPQTEAFTSEAALQDLLIGSVIGDQLGNLWVGTWSGLVRRAPGAGTFATVPLVRDPTAQHRVQELYVDRSGMLWISTQNDGLFRLDPALADGSTPAVSHFPQDANDPRSPGTSPVMGFHEDANGALWLATVEDGLVRYDRETQTFVHFTPDAGAAKYVSCIEEDAKGNLWMGTALGLARFDPARETFSYFDARDGLLIGEGITCFRNEQGEMFFGSWAGLVAFFPDQIRDNPHPPVVVITALNLRNQVLRTDLLPDERIKLSYRENYLSFDFAALDYAAPAKNQYAYKMEGLDADWVEVGTRRHADYPDLKPGTYTFRVKASNNSGVWNEQGTAVRITIAPPFWQTWWFLGLVGVVLAGAVAGAVRLRLKGAEARSRDLEAQVASRTGELVALNEIATVLNRPLDLLGVLSDALEKTLKVTRVEAGGIYLLDEKTQVLTIAAHQGFSPQFVGEIDGLQAGEGFSGLVIRSGETLVVRDVSADPRLTRMVVRDEGFHSLAVVPLKSRDQVRGTLFALTHGHREFTGQDVQLLESIGHQVGAAIESARLYERSQELAVLEERGRLARELHDAVTQTLFSASLVAEALPTTWERDAQEGRGLLHELRGLCRGALAEMRTLLLELRPARLVETRLDDLLRQLGEAASGREGIPVTVQVEGMASPGMPPLPPDVHIAFYRITQEALNNVVKHARARQVTVRLHYHSDVTYTTEIEAAAGFSGQRTQPAKASTLEEQPSRYSVLLSISDDGRGFDPAQVPHDRLGLGNMQERAQAIGADLTVESQPGRGTQVTVLWNAPCNT